MKFMFFIAFCRLFGCENIYQSFLKQSFLMTTKAAEIMWTTMSILYMFTGNNALERRQCPLFGCDDDAPLLQILKRPVCFSVLSWLHLVCCLHIGRVYIYIYIMYCLWCVYLACVLLSVIFIPMDAIDEGV